MRKQRNDWIFWAAHFLPVNYGWCPKLKKSQFGKWLTREFTKYPVTLNKSNVVYDQFSVERKPLASYFSGHSGFVMS